MNKEAVTIVSHSPINIQINSRYLFGKQLESKQRRVQDSFHPNLSLN